MRILLAVDIVAILPSIYAGMTREHVILVFLTGFPGPSASFLIGHTALLSGIREPGLTAGSPPIHNQLACEGLSHVGSHPRGAVGEPSGV